MITSGTITSGIAVSTSALRTLLDAPHQVKSRYAEIATDLGGGVDELRPRVGSHPSYDLAELLPPPDDEEFAGRALVIVLFARAAGAKGPIVRERGTLEVKDTLMTGDLHVEGDAVVNGTLIVLGDFSCSGSLKVSGRLVVGRALTVAQGITSDGFMAIGGPTKCSLMLLEGPNGFAKLVEGVECDYFLERGQRGTRIFGKLRCNLAGYDTAIFDEEPLKADDDALRAIFG